MSDDPVDRMVLQVPETPTDPFAIRHGLWMFGLVCFRRNGSSVLALKQVNQERSTC